jgi:general stress protein 26
MKTTNPNEDPASAAKLHELIDDIAVAMLTTVTPDGTLHSRPMFTRQLKEERELWFVLLDDSDIAEDLAAEPGVNVIYAAPARDRYVSVTGNASVVHDERKLDALWDDSLAKYFPGGRDNPHVALLQVRVEYAEYWDGAAGGTRNPAGHARRKGKSKGKQEAGGADPHVRLDVREVRASG